MSGIRRTPVVPHLGSLEPSKEGSLSSCPTSVIPSPEMGDDELVQATYLVF